MDRQLRLLEQQLQQAVITEFVIGAIISGLMAWVLYWIIRTAVRDGMRDAQGRHRNSTPRKELSDGLRTHIPDIRAD